MEARRAGTRAGGGVAICLALALAQFGCDGGGATSTADRQVRLTSYLQDLTTALADIAADPMGRQTVPSVRVLDEPIVQASARPPDRITVSTGLLSIVQNEAEIACVLAHELAHLRLGHDPIAPDGAAEGPFPDWSDSAEAEADRAGLDLCAAAGYAPIAAADLLYRAALRRSAGRFDAAPEDPVTRRLQAMLEHIDAAGIDGGTFAQAEYARGLAGSGAALPAASYQPSALDFLEEPYVDHPEWCLALLRFQDEIYANGQAASVEWVESTCEDASIGGVPINQYDAFGHCWYGCESTRVAPWCGNPGALREVYRELESEFGGRDHDSFWEDWHNQNTGVRLGNSGYGSCYARCARAIESGALDLSAPERFWVDCDTLERTDEPPDNPTDFGSTSIYGEPHLVTLDGLRYDFQAAGEFVALRSPLDLDIQVRLSPVAALSASRITAVAIRSNGERIGAYVDRNEFEVVRDGVTEPPSAAWLNLADAARLQVEADQLVVELTDGSTIGVYAWYDVIDLKIRLAGRHRGRTSGLLGNFDRDPDNEFVTREGRTVSLQGLAGQERWNALYRVFGDSWRVDAAESLFDYPPGQSTADHRIDDFPEQMLTVDDLDADSVRLAEDVCRARGLTADAWLETCVFDVALTGDARFADSSALAAGLLDRAPKPRFASQLDVSTPGTHVFESFQAEAGDPFFFLKLAVDESLGLADWVLLAPDGSIVFRDCVIRCNEPGRVVLEQSGVYVSQLVTEDGQAGEISVVRSRVPDPQRFVVAGTEGFDTERLGPGAGRIELPGSVDVYEFDVATPSELLVTLEHREGRLYFGRWRLTGPDGQELFQGLLPSSQSSRRTRLIQPGRYRLTVDGGESWPSGDDFGHGAYRIVLGF